MGARYFWDEKCEHCGTTHGVMYAESNGITTWKCDTCGREYDIIMKFESISIPNSGQKK